MSVTGLSIAELAEASGVNEATLRMWESRHGFPTPERLQSGRRRYSERDVEAVRAVVRARAEGLSLAGAIGRARRLVAEPAPSVYRTLRERFPELQPSVLEERAVLRLCRALEDECSLRAERPVLFGCFQRERAYRRAERRWREMTATSELAVVFADFPRVRAEPPAPIEIPLDSDAELGREWVVVFDAANLTACLAAWERPAGAAGARVFETVWTVERPASRHAARVCAELAARADPGLLARVRERLSDEPVPNPGDVRTAVAIASRVVAYTIGEDR